jgi:hypothetical protein
MEIRSPLSVAGEGASSTGRGDPARGSTPCRACRRG